MSFEEFKEKYQKVPVEHYPNTVSDSPLVSVCVQTYNHSSYIGQCLDGILMQKTDFDFEILLGEDASADGTREICKDYAIKYPGQIRLMLHHRENNMKIDGSATGRFNLLYNLYWARGQYIALCEGDDYWIEPNKLQWQIDFLKANKDYQLCFHNAFYNRRGKNQFLFTDRFPFLQHKNTFTQLNILRYKWFIPTASIVYQNNIEIPEWLTQVKGADLGIIYLNSTAGKLKFIDFNGSVYRKHAGGLTAIKSGKAEKLIKRRREILVYLKITPWRYKVHPLKWLIMDWIRIIRYRVS